MKNNKLRTRCSRGERELQQKCTLFCFPNFYEEAEKREEFQIKDWSIHFWELFHLISVILH